MQLAVLSEGELRAILLSLAVLLLASFAFGRLFQALHAPKVVGQITGGILLGSTFMAHFLPDTMQHIFMAFGEEGKVLNIFYQLGLIFLMFASGLNTRIELDRGNRKLVGILFLGATLLPFGAGYLIYPYFTESFIGELHHVGAFMIVFLNSLAVTSIPVISQIFFDLHLMNTHFSNNVLTVATIQDLFLWIFLNMAIAMSSGQGKELSGMLVTVAVTVLLFVVAHQASKLASLPVRMSSASFSTMVLAFLFLMVTALSELHINIMYSAFLAGYIVKFLAGKKQEYEDKVQGLSDVAFSFFIPVYFALIGIQLNLLHDFSLDRFLIYFAIAFGLEFLGCYSALKLTRLKHMAVLNFSIVMNARGGPGIVLASIAYYYKIINVEFFTILILTTMLSSAIAGYWLEYRKGKDSTIFMDMYRKSE